jgi:hypothetical protein
MEDMREVKELLREIRDLQKANLEDAKEVRQAALARQQSSAEEAQRARQEQRRLNEEMAQEVKDTQAAARKKLNSPWAFVALMAFLAVMAACGVILMLSAHIR